MLPGAQRKGFDFKRKKKNQNLAVDTRQVGTAYRVKNIDIYLLKGETPLKTELRH